MDILSGAPTSSRWGSYRDPSPYPDIRGIQEENARLLQSLQTFRATLKELHEARREMKELIGVARSLREDMERSTASSHSSYRPLGASAATSQPNPTLLQPDAEAEEDWPAPPPWPDPEDSLLIDLSDLNLGPQDTHQNHLPHSPPDQAQSSYKPPVFTLTHYQFPHYDHALSPPPLPTQAQDPQYCHKQQPRRAGRRPVTRAPPSSPPTNHPVQAPVSELVYRGPKPTIPKLIQPDPSEFARLRLALENLLPPNSTELFRYQILIDHLKLEEAKLIADAYLNSPTPYTDTMRALYDRFGQPHQLALKKIASVLEAPEIRRGDSAAFQRFSLQIQSLVGLLKTLGPEGEIELNCGSHVARLLTKLPAEQRADFRRHQFKQPGTSHTLHDLSQWLSYES